MSTDLPGSPTLEDVARVAGVSRATVSRVINGIRNVAPEIQEAVNRAVATVGYVPNRAARSLVTRRAGAVALVVSGAGDERPSEARVFADPFFGRVAGGILGFLRPRAVHPVLMLAETPEARDEVIAFIRQGSADGALVVSAHGEDPLPGLLAAAGVPAVLWGRPARPVPISYVDLDQRLGAALAAGRLVERGRRRVATISGPPGLPASQDRLSGFREAMARSGHPYVPDAEGDFSVTGGESAMRRLIADHPGLDGVFAANDLMAEGALRALRDRGLRVPEDVAVVGFDDAPAAAQCLPPLTTVRQPMEEMAAEMARLLLAHVDDPGLEATSRVFRPTLVVRGSA
ncbi:LacI family DNA-binding transcriptional regulator [Microbispora sp. RL4-1S]|uniref:LacI family DNA-binding transcriptional regulator n=1 Tax=Microbispora oryzae TaxID=2806554 RepID=A0A941AJB6_9ACTN|nr:LacI family DNA-binding transcriptional regulator [Microbispora oryzae]MBP2704038.1 LacI family DNA-binding transcriptional regulator [Microbispora oryzae]